jgi:hypothetical protein
VRTTTASSWHLDLIAGHDQDADGVPFMVGYFLKSAMFFMYTSQRADMPVWW